MFEARAEFKARNLKKHVAVDCKAAAAATVPLGLPAAPMEPGTAGAGDAHGVIAAAHAAAPAATT